MLLKLSLRNNNKNKQNKYIEPGITQNKLDRKATQKTLQESNIPKEAMNRMSTDNTYKMLGNDRNIIK